MSRIETEVYKQEADDIIGVRVIVYNDVEEEIDNIIVVSSNDLQKIKSDLANHNHDNTYISIDNATGQIRSIVERTLQAEMNSYLNITFELEEDGDLYVDYYRTMQEYTDQQIDECMDIITGGN